MKIPGRIRPWLAPVLITAAVWLLWLPFLAGGSIRFDNDLMISRPDTALSRYISEGRPGLVLLLHVLGLTAFNPLKSALLFLVFFTGAAWLPVLFLRRTGSPLSGQSTWLFLLLYATSPVWAYQFYFTLQLAPVGLGMLLTAGSFLLVGFSAGFASEAGIVSAWWLVGSYFLSSIGELLISGLGLSMISKLVPQRLLGFLMGAWFLTTSIAAVLGGKVAALTAIPEGVTDSVETLGIYTGVFTQIGLVTLGVTVLMAILVPVLNKLINKTDEVDEESATVMNN